MSENSHSNALSSPALQDERWRQTHLGRLLGHAMWRFDQRVLHLMAGNDGVPLALANLASRDQISAAHVHITRHLALDGSRLTDLARAAGMSKQAMGDLVDQCAAWGLVQREADPLDARAQARGVHARGPGLAAGLQRRGGSGRSRISRTQWARTWLRWWPWGWRPMPQAQGADDRHAWVRSGHQGNGVDVASAACLASGSPAAPCKSH
jgi:hypothetical protein